MADPPDAGNPVRLISPFHKIVGVSWAKKPSGGTALIKLRNQYQKTSSFSAADQWGINLRYQVKDSHGNPGTITTIPHGMGCTATGIADEISIPAGFHSFYSDGPSWPDPNLGANALPPSGVGTVPGSVPIGTPTKDLAGYYAVFENGLGAVPVVFQVPIPNYCISALGTYLDGAFDNGASSFLCEGAFGTQFDPGSLSFTYYALVNLTQIVNDFGGTNGLANVFIDISGAQCTMGTSDGLEPLIECNIWENGPTVMGVPGYPKFKGGTDADGFARGIIFDTTGPGTERVDLRFSSTYGHGDLGPGSAALIKTITWNTSGPPG